MISSSEFLSEAQELIEAFSRRLFEIEGQIQDRQDYDPDLLNGAFRSVHTLKSLANLAGAEPLEGFSHELEETLDALRLGKFALDEKALNSLFMAVELFQALLEQTIDPDRAAAIDVEPFLAQLARLAAATVTPAGAGSEDPAWLDGSILGVLTEFEEHRLRENIRRGRGIFRVSASFDLMAIDVGIDAIKRTLGDFGEVVTFVPSPDGSRDDQIALDILVGSKRSLTDIAEAIAGQALSVEALGTGKRLIVSAEPAAAIPPTPAPSEPSEPEPQPSEPEPPPSEPEPQPSEPEPQPSEPVEPLEPVEEEHEQTGLRQTVSVDLQRLDQLMNLVGELSLVHTNLDGTVKRMQREPEGPQHIREFRDQLRVMSRRLGPLQQGILEVRMISLKSIFDSMSRLARKVSRELDKDIRMTVSGANTELDKLIVEGLKNPLMHMIKNAIDHGIETAQERLALGKPPGGRLSLAAYQRGNRVLIELTDDGRGMDWRAIRMRAVDRGFITPEEAGNLNPGQAINLIFTPGFSTKQQATETSGRGVGMDVVKTNIAKLAGMIDVTSEPGRGSLFRITLPITLAIIQALVIETGGQIFCIPLSAVLESIMVQTTDIHTIEGHQVISVRGRTLPLIYLSQIFNLDSQAPKAQRQALEHPLYVVVVGLAHDRIGLVVDELLGQQDVVIKPLGKALRQVPGIAGATELGDNRTVLLLDVGTLVSEAVGGVENLQVDFAATRA